MNVQKKQYTKRMIDLQKEWGYEFNMGDTEYEVVDEVVPIMSEDRQQRDDFIEQIKDVEKQPNLKIQPSFPYKLEQCLDLVFDFVEGFILNNPTTIDFKKAEKNYPKELEKFIPWEDPLVVQKIIECYKKNKKDIVLVKEEVFFSDEDALDFETIFNYFYNKEK